MGMLATVINSICMKDALERAGAEAVVMSSVPMSPLAENYSSDVAKKYLSEGKIVVFGCGLGIPFLSTDTAGAVKAAEIEADVVLMAKNIDGIYSADPKTDPTAYKFDEITYKEIIDKNIRAYDLTATIFCMDNNINTYAFALKDPMNIYKVITGENVGTETHN
jgi:uridylate kinase